MDSRQKEMVLHSLESSGHCEIGVGGRSMRPFIEPGDLVHVVKGLRGPAVGRVVAFFNDEQMIVHRILGYNRQAGAFLIAGDSSPGSGTHIEESAIAGTVIFTTRNKRTQKAFFNPPMQFIAVAVSFFLRSVAGIIIKVKD